MTSKHQIHLLSAVSRLAKLPISLNIIKCLPGLSDAKDGQKTSVKTFSGLIEHYMTT